ncbi:unnamed protein product [Lactuca virosa]|uniref:Uncharacterized protein n=1 Tax=Lactuca virosa TaxID=75947 RepID=A0AAU9MWP2_9ASTR|nr:unnamed protein product [Lactuca virosa]
MMLVTLPLPVVLVDELIWPNAQDIHLPIQIQYSKLKSQAQSRRKIQLKDHSEVRISFPINTSSSDTLVKDTTGSPPVAAVGLPSPRRRRHCFLHPRRRQTFFLLANVLFFLPVAGILLNSFVTG